MEDLIKSLIQQHEEIVGILEKLKDTGLSSGQKKDLLLEAKTTFLRHLSLEDVKLYPVLNEAAKRNQDLKMTLDKSAVEMKQITNKVLGFFDKIDSYDLASIDFANEYADFYTLFNERMRKEETVLYEEYKKVYAHIS